MNYFEIWIDESGDFSDHISKDHPSLMGGVIVRNENLSKEKARAFLRPHTKLHSNLLQKEEFNSLVEIFLERIDPIRISPFIIENSERLNIVDARTTYFTVFAEGIMQIINTLYLEQPESEITLNIAKKMTKKDETLFEEFESEYIKRLLERINLLKITNRNYANISLDKIHINILSALEDPRLMVADLICHAWYRKTEKLSENVSRKLKNYCEPYCYSIRIKMSDSFPYVFF